MKCGNCNIDFPNKKAMIAHMLIMHNSEFEADSHPEYVESAKQLKAGMGKATMADMQKFLRGEY